MKDTTFDLTKGSQVDVAVNFMQSILTQQYSDVPKFVSRLGELRSRVNSSYGSTARRLELELMNVGKVS